MKYALLALAVAGLSGCGAVSGPAPTLEEELQRAANFFNSEGTRMLPEQFGKARVEAEVVGEDLIVVRLLDLPSGHATIDPGTARRMMRPKLCDSSTARGVLERGGKIRTEIISNIGVEVTSFQIASC